MCGIVGIAGTQPVAHALLDGLKRLEYRGYDSAGLALGAKNSLETWKSVGKVCNLATQLNQLPVAPSAVTGIAHTRWATHGAPLEKNAHPHLDSSRRFAVVHNGIIENYWDLRRQLEAKGHTFYSDTDSEVIPNLIAEFDRGDLAAAVAEATRHLVGTFGIAAIALEEPGTIVAARNGSPIVIGLGETANMLASDVAALVAYTRNVIYLNDGELAILTAQKVEVRSAANQVVTPEIAKIDWEDAATGKGGFEHYMLKEIHEQPDAVADTIRGRIDFSRCNAVLSGLNLSPRDLAAITRIVIAGCGSSMHAGMVGEYYFEDIAGIPCEVEQAAEFRYRNPILEPNTLVIPISQSGETADTLAAVREALTKGALVAAISNVVGSTIAREAGRGVYLHAGPEISVASTKAFTAQVTTLLLMAILIGRNRRLNREQGEQILQELSTLPDLLRRVIAQSDRIQAIAEKYASAEDLFFIGRGCLYPVACEGALKLKEISYIHAEGYHAAELKHGPIALLERKLPVIALANDIPGRDKMLGNIQECLARFSPVIAVATEGSEGELKKFTQDVMIVPRTSRFLAPLTTVVALQLFAYFFARKRGCEIDQPRNLAKSVTVE